MITQSIKSMEEARRQKHKQRTFSCICIEKTKSKKGKENQCLFVKTIETKICSEIYNSYERKLFLYSETKPRLRETNKIKQSLGQ